jgi:fido (protein-threonine AMPylation protein)
MILRPRSSTSGDLALGDLQSTSRPSIISTFRIPLASGITDQSTAEPCRGRPCRRTREAPRAQPSSPPVSFDTLRAIHHELFHDVCTWAGQVRTTQIDKRQYDDHTSRVQMFATPDTIEARADALFRSLTEQNFLAGSNRDGFAAGATAVFAELNAIHFARKCNGRTNRLLLSARAANAGHALAFDVITRERMIAVSVAADEDDPSDLRRMHPHHPRWATLLRRADRARESTSCCGLGTATTRREWPCPSTCLRVIAGGAPPVVCSLVASGTKAGGAAPSPYCGLQRARCVPGRGIPFGRARIAWQGGCRGQIEVVGMHSQSFVGRDPWTVLSGSPSGACGLGRAAVARKRRVLAMLATRGLEAAHA